jgi:hypothetical protein
MKVSDDSKHVEYDARELVILMELDARLGVLEERLLSREEVSQIRKEWADTLRAIGIPKESHDTTRSHD